MKKKFSLILIVLVTVVLLFASCAESDPEYGIHRDGEKITIVLPNSNKATKLPAEIILPETLADYKIIREEITDQTVIESAMLLRDALSEKGIQIGLGTDWVKRDTVPPADTLEILVGKTNRLESPAYRSLRANDFIIKFENNRLVICGGCSDSTKKAVECFIDYFIDKTTGEILIPKGKEYFFESGTLTESYTLNGVNLCDYQVEFASSTVDIALDEYIRNVTGYTPLEESEHKIILDTKADTDTCRISAADGNIYISGSDTVNINMAARTFMVYLDEQAKLDPDKFNQKASLTIDKEIIITSEDYLAQEECFIYVSTNGSDDGDGSAEAPLASVAAARDRANELKKFTTKPITVLFEAGDYYFTETVNFYAKDSGDLYAPITFCAADGAKVNFYGGIKIDPSLVSPAKDKSVVDRVIDKDAASKLMQIDLSGIFDSIAKEYSYGNTTTDSQYPITVYINENPLDRSRWPNESDEKKFLTTTSRVDKNADGTKSIFFNEDAYMRIMKWGDEASKDLFIYGYLAHDWSSEVYSASKLDWKFSKITLDGGLTESYWNDLGGNKRYYFFNLPEEIDVPGESYTDYENRIIYFLPEEDFDENEVFVSTIEKQILYFQDVKNIVVHGINFMYTRQNALTATVVQNFTVNNCKFAHTSSNAVTFSGTHVTFSNNEIYDTAKGGVSFYGGDSVSLTPSHTIAYNNRIRNINRDNTSYNPGIYAEAYAMTISHNEMSDSAHVMITVASNDILIEYNEIYNCVLEASDMGAIYMGRNPRQMGTVMRYNFFHDIGNPYSDGTGQQAIYNDDGNNGIEIYGNVFLRATQNKYAVYTHGAQFSKITGNVFIDLPTAYGNSDWEGDNKDGYQERWFMWLYDRWPGTNHEIIAKLQKVDFDSALWREHYKGTIWGQIYNYIDDEKIEEYAKLSDEEFKALANKMAPLNSNIFSGNVLVNVEKGSKENDAPYNGGTCTCENNYITDNNDLFIDYGIDFRLTDDALAEIRKTIPDFEQIPFDKMGLVDPN